MELRHDTQAYVGLVDTGADINCISTRVCKSVKFKWIQRQQQRISGVSGPSCSDGIVEVDFQIATGHVVKQQFAVLRKFGTGIILGLPFLCEGRAQIYVVQELIATRFGCIPMVYGYQVIAANDRSLDKLPSNVVGKSVQLVQGRAAGDQGILEA
ncbi:MAG: retropepsin-like aspartic protease, partial [Sphingobacterium sp.]